jgi:hypothetical protein
MGVKYAEYSDIDLIDDTLAFGADYIRKPFKFVHSPQKRSPMSNKEIKRRGELVALFSKLLVTSDKFSDIIMSVPPNGETPITSEHIFIILIDFFKEAGIDIPSDFYITNFITDIINEFNRSVDKPKNNQSADKPTNNRSVGKPKKITVRKLFNIINKNSIKQYHNGSGICEFAHILKFIFKKINIVRLTHLNC